MVLKIKDYYWIILLAILLILVNFSGIYFFVSFDERNEEDPSDQISQNNDIKDNKEVPDDNNKGSNEDNADDKDNDLSEDNEVSLEPDDLETDIDLVTLNRARKHKSDHIRFARQELGLNPPMPLLASQIHAESHWQAQAVSPVGAKGLAQVMPRTAEHIVELGNLDSIELNSPRWSLRAQVIYINWLDGIVSKWNADREKDHWAFILSGYNGGIGHINNERKEADNPRRWYGSAEHIQKRSDAAFRENRNYIPKIKSKQDAYHRLSWPGPVIKGD